MSQIQQLEAQIEYLNSLQDKGMLTLQGHDFQVKQLRKEIEFFKKLLNN